MKSNFLSMECLRHGLIPKSIRQHCRENSGRALRQSLFRHIAADVALTTIQIQHPDDWWAHRAKEYLVPAAANGTAQVFCVHHPKDFLPKYPALRNAKHPWPLQFYYPVPSRYALQFVPELLP